MPLSELKSLCLVELVKLSSEQVKAVLAGRPCPSDDDSATSDSERGQWLMGEGGDRWAETEGRW